MRQSEQRLQELAAAYAQPAFGNAPLKYAGFVITTEAHEESALFAGSTGAKLLSGMQIPMNPLSAEQLATGLAVSYQTSAKQWL